jgi:hypothetical protein
MEQGEELQIDQNQCRRLKGYYSVYRPKRVAERQPWPNPECDLGTTVLVAIRSDERPRRISLRRGHLWITRTPKR